MPNPMEEMQLPCPHDICDGSGVIKGEFDEDDRDCLCKTDKELEEVY